MAVASKLAVGGALFLSVLYHLGAATTFYDLRYYAFWYLLSGVPVWYFVAVSLPRFADELGKALVPIIMPFAIIWFIIAVIWEIFVGYGDFDFGSSSSSSRDLSDAEILARDVGVILIVIVLSAFPKAAVFIYVSEGIKGSRIVEDTTTRWSVARNAVIDEATKSWTATSAVDGIAYDFSRLWRLLLLLASCGQYGVARQQIPMVQHWQEYSNSAVLFCCCR